MRDTGDSEEEGAKNGDTCCHAAKDVRATASSTHQQAFPLLTDTSLNPLYALYNVELEAV